MGEDPFKVFRKEVRRLSEAGFGEQEIKNVVEREVYWIRLQHALREMQDWHNELTAFYQKTGQF